MLFNIIHQTFHESLLMMITYLRDDRGHIADQLAKKELAIFNRKKWVYGGKKQSRLQRRGGLMYAQRGAGLFARGPLAIRTVPKARG